MLIFTKKKIDIYVHINELLFCTPETNTILQMNNTSILKRFLIKKNTVSHSSLQKILEPCDLA